MTERNQHGHGVLLLWWGVLLLALLRLAVAMGEGRAVRPFYDSDVLYLPALFQDLAAGGAWSGWKLPHTPYYFPDMGLYFLVHALLGNLHASMLAYGMLQVLLLAGLTLFVVRRLHGVDPALSVLTLAGVTALVAALGSGADVVLPMALMSATHFGAFLMLLAALGGGVACWRAPSARLYPWLGFLFLLCLVALASDFLFMIQFALPMALVLLFLAARHAGVRRRALLLAGTLLAGCGAGWGVLLGVVQHNTLDRHIGLDFSQLGWVEPWLRQLPEQHPWGVGTGLLFLALLLRVAWSGRARSDASALVPLYWLVAFGTMLASLLTKDQLIYRYILPVIFVALFVGWPMLLPWLPAVRAGVGHPRFMKLAGVSALGVGLWMAPALAGLPSLPNLLEFRTPLSRCLDDQAAEHGLVNGLGDYWEAKSTSLLSRRGVSVVQVLPDLGPYHHINNIQWYNRPFQFVVINHGLPPEARINKEMLLARFGPPKAAFRCDVQEVLVYPRPEDKEFRDQFTALPPFLKLENPGDAITLHPVWMPTENGLVAGNGRVAVAPPSGPGLLLAGLGYSLPPGRQYIYQIFYVSQGVEERSPGYWSLLREHNGVTSVTKVADFPGMGAGAVAGVLTVPEGVRTDLLVHYKGEGMLAIPYLTIQIPK